MSKLKAASALTAIAVVGLFGVTACGSDDDEDTGGGGGSAKKGGSISIGTVGPDSYDPALFQTVQAVQALQLVYTPLTTYRHAEGDAGAELIPGLAEGLPKVSNGGKT